MAGRALLVLVLVLLTTVAATIAAIESSWGKDRIRSLIVREANRFLTADLAIGRLSGSFTSGLELHDVTLSRDGRALVAIDAVVLEYSLRELWYEGTSIRRLQLVRPRIAAAREADGRWNLATLVKRDARQQERSGPGRPITIQTIELVDATISLGESLQFGAAHVPSAFLALNASLSFSYAPVRWRLGFNRMDWIGRAPDLTVNQLSGALSHDSEGWLFEALSVTTPRSAFVMNGRVLSGQSPTVLDLAARSERFSFQEWSGILGGLKNIAVDGSFDVSLKGPGRRLDTQVALSGTGGTVNGRLTLDTTIPGWHGAGTINVARLNLAKWLNRADRPSDISGRVVFDLDLDLGRHFPRGTYTFDGPHAMYLAYAADDVRAEGRLTAKEVLIARASALAYGASVTATDSTIGIDTPFPFRFQGTMNELDLREVPVNVPVPHVDSRLAFDYDVSGRFSEPYIAGRATFAASEFLGAEIDAGTTGAIDTQATPVAYSGDGTITNVNLKRFGEGLDVAWLQEPRYAGTVAGHFHVDGAGTSAKTMSLTATGQLARASVFRGAVSDADVTLDIEQGTLKATVKGPFADIDPAVPFADPRFAASLSGSVDASIAVQDLLTRTTTLTDYRLDGRMTLSRSTVRELPIDTATVEATLTDGRLAIAQLTVDAPAIAGTAAGILPLNSTDPFDLRYDVTRADLAELRSVTGGSASGLVITRGQLTGPVSAPRAAGEGSVSGLDAFGVNALTLSGQYDVARPSGTRPTGRITAAGSFLTLFGRAVQSATGSIALAGERADFDIALTDTADRTGRASGAVGLHEDARTLDLLDLTVTLGTLPWRLRRSDPAPVVSWNDGEIAITPTTFVTGPNQDERIAVSGTWRTDGAGTLRVQASDVRLETLEMVQSRPPRYGGIVQLDATIQGTRSAPLASGTFSVTSGRVDRVTYEKLAGRVEYANGLLAIDLLLDQSPGVWLAAKGTVPLGLFDADLPERPVDVAFTSSTIDLGLITGVTDVVRNARGQMHLDMHATGTSREPRFTGAVTLADAGFIVAQTGVRYKNGRASLRLSDDLITVETLHLEDSDGHALDANGSLSARQFRTGDVAVDATASRFTIIDNEFGKIDLNATLRLRGQLAAPRLAGSLTINGGTLKVDRVLERALFQPYSTQQVALAPVDAVAALNPWNRLGLDLFLRVPETLRITGTNVQVTSGAPVGVGDINIRAGGDLYLYKDPGQPVSVTGSLDALSGTYAFQGRRFTINQGTSSINFVGDLDPNLYVTVNRVINGVEAHVTIGGSLRQPELRLTSTPPLDESDILSLIVFNTDPNSLSAIQQQELAVRAGALAAGFLAGPLLSAVQNDLGLEAFQIEPTGELGAGPRVTIGQELAPGLVARFSRQFGQNEFDEVTLEYYLSRLLRLRATFSDAQGLAAATLFRRVERAGIDLLVFLSF